MNNSNRFSLILSTLSMLIIVSNLGLLSKVEARAWNSDLFQTDGLSKLTDQFMNSIKDGDSKDIKTKAHWSFEDCGSPTDAITIKSFDVQPDPPKPGKNLTVTASGTVNSIIEEGSYADVTVKLGAYIKLLHKQFDICEELPKSNLTLRCPIEPGDYDIFQTVELPREIPPAKYTVQIRAFTADDEDLSCLNLMVDFTNF